MYQIDNNMMRGYTLILDFNFTGHVPFVLEDWLSALTIELIQLYLANGDLVLFPCPNVEVLTIGFDSIECR